MSYELIYKEQFEDLNNELKTAVVEFLTDPNTKSNVSIQLQDIDYGDEYETVMYGFYDMTDDEVSNYDSNGGLWLYSDTNELINKFGIK